MPADTHHEKITITTADGFPLVARVFHPATDNGQAIALAPATGVPCRFYADFCAWLADQGYRVLTWDWRGIGDNAPDSLRGFEADMLTWGKLDLPAVLDWFVDNGAGRLIAIGHSFGGQVFGFWPRRERYAQIVLLASGNAWWRLWPRPDRYVFRGTIGLLKLIARATGYLPGRALGLGADLPRDAALQWFDWCSRPDYHGDWEGAAGITAPVLSFGFSDDGYAPEAPRRWLLDRYGGERTFLTLQPQDAGLERIGHLDFFRRRNGDALWPLLLERLRR